MGKEMVVNSRDKEGKIIRKQGWIWLYALLLLNLAVFTASLFLLQPVWFDTNRFLSWALGAKFHWVWIILALTFLIIGYALYVLIKLIKGFRIGNTRGPEMRRIHCIIPFPIFVIWNSMLGLLISELNDEIWLFRTQLESAAPWILLGVIFLVLLFGSIVFRPLGNLRFRIAGGMVLIFSIIYISNDLGPINITTGPYLQSLDSSSMTIRWITDSQATGWVEYGTDNDLSLIARRYNDGLWDVNDRLHRMTLNNLKSGTRYFYRVASQKINNLYPNNVEFGGTIKSKTFSFETPVNAAEEVSFIVINDLHAKTGLIPKMIKIGGRDSLDMVFFNGDVLSHIDTERQITTQFLNPLAESFAAEIPFVFVRGKLARKLHRYVE